MKEKSNKEKCLTMWKWLADHPEAAKVDYFIHCLSTDKIKNYNPCWACVEARKQSEDLSLTCFACPIAFPHDSNNKRDCYHPRSPYHQWMNAKTKAAAFEAASEMVNLIIHTWKE